MYIQKLFFFFQLISYFIFFSKKSILHKKYKNHIFFFKKSILHNIANPHQRVNLLGPHIQEKNLVESHSWIFYTQSPPPATTPEDDRLSSRASPVHPKKFVHQLSSSGSTARTVSLSTKRSVQFNTKSPLSSIQYQVLEKM